MTGSVIPALTDRRVLGENCDRLQRGRTGSVPSKPVLSFCGSQGFTPKRLCIENPREPTSDFSSWGRSWQA